MKNLFTLLCALLLCQSVTFAQNELHIYMGDSTKIVPTAQLDSVTIRDKMFYDVYGEWEYLTTGTYTYNIYFEGDDPSLDVYMRKGNRNSALRQYRVDNWGDGVSLVIDCDLTTGQCKVEPQFTGNVNELYGEVWVADYAIYSGDNSHTSKFDSSTGKFELYLVYYVDAGYFSPDYEYLQLDGQKFSSNSERKAGGKVLRARDVIIKGNVKEKKSGAVPMRLCPIDPTMK